ncbi:hypothetical protein GCM10010329_82710 [Streptomyces spiroverticillatus]|uniref:Uncharacterized protein n=1 Tax=Streptomyces finlayi TaxID=67296 RepID=A0A919CFX9_9ACTN|nr:DUF6248 family natural product biosynthesis protein [Streptomyces finlayi]GHA47752.1 hypothetical protein GCM10010329_82710 [Streptomyces spiroverticillatus]GHD18714.1 hypothetical protein GCM10010334_81780 [Streptomyces finlayi]
MSEHTAGRDALPPPVYVRVAQEAAELAVEAADSAMFAACRAAGRTAAMLESRMHTAHQHACDAQKWARWAASWQQDGVTVFTLANYAARAVTAAVHAQHAAHVEITAEVLHTQLERPLTAAERAEKDREARREEAEEEARERAATGMDAENRHTDLMNRFYAEHHVPRLGWTAGHVRVLEAAGSGRLYWKDHTARQARTHGMWEGGRRISRERVKALFASRFLCWAAPPAGGARVLALTPSGRTALALARLFPQGLFPDDQTAYLARYARAARRWMTSDDKKDAARRLPPLGRSALRAYRPPVTLAEQQARAEQQAADQWEDEGGYCPGVLTPRPAPAPHARTTPPTVRTAAADSPKAEVAAESTARPRFHPQGLRARRQRQKAAARTLTTPVQRPQRALTTGEQHRVQRMKLLNLQGALLMGILDPVPNPSPMSEEQGAWVRENAWPHHMLKIEAKYPFGFARWSMCERGTCWNCWTNRCDLCVHRQQDGPTVDNNTDWIYSTTGHVIAQFIPRPNSEPCVWWCRCACAKTGPTPTKSRERQPDQGQPYDNEPGADTAGGYASDRNQKALF